MMTPQMKMIRVLCIGDNEEIYSWLSQQLKSYSAPVKLRQADGLRMAAPEYQIKEQDVIVVQWGRSHIPTEQDIIERVSAEKRSFESTIFDLEKILSEFKMGKILVIGPEIKREDAVFLAELNCRHIHSLPEKRSLWAAESSSFFKRFAALLESESSENTNKEQISDQKKMEAHDELLKSLGTTAKYFELMAKKCMKESNLVGAEKWLCRATEKNPSYLSPLQALADLYMRTNRFGEALSLLEKLRLSNPKHLGRLTKIGKCQLALGAIDKAEKSFVEALQVDEFYGEAREELGKVKILKKDFEAAKNLLSMNANAKKMAAFLNNLGIQLVEQKKYSESIALYLQAQYVLPGNEVSHLLFFNIGLAFAKWGRVKEAQKYVNLALIKEPKYERATLLMKTLDNKSAAA
jgi:tetratricopeptide (TPR) repeat protein